MSLTTYKALDFDSELFDFPVACMHLEKPEILASLVNIINENIHQIYHLSLASGEYYRFTFG